MGDNSAISVEAEFVVHKI